MIKDSIIEKKDYINYTDISVNGILNNKLLRIYLVDDKIDLYNDIARMMANKLIKNNKKGIKTSFILPVGPRGQYTRFAHICNTEKISCRDLITINMDEFLDDRNNLIPKKHPLSFRGFMERNLFNLLGSELKMKPSNIFFPDPKNINQIEDIIEDTKGVDVCFGGIGINGHIAFNEPISTREIASSKFMSLKTRILDLKKETIIMSGLKYGGNIDLIPRKCITLGMVEIFKSKELRFYLEHDWQNMVLVRSIFEKPNSNFPASFVKEHINSSITVSKNVLCTDYNKYRH